MHTLMPNLFSLGLCRFCPSPLTPPAASLPGGRHCDRWQVTLTGKRLTVPLCMTGDTVIGSVFVTRGTTARERGPAMALLAGAAAAAYIPGAGQSAAESPSSELGTCELCLRFGLLTQAGLIRCAIQWPVSFYVAAITSHFY